MTSRRAFLGWLAAAVPATAIIRRAHALAVDHIADDPRALRALGEAVLPSNVGPVAVERFQQWIAKYREGAELLHGYGTSKLEFAGATPATHWSKQMDDLDKQAAKQFGRRFADLAIPERRIVLTAQLEPFRTARLGATARAPHIALALLSHFYAGTDATDLCYEAQIGKQTCRPLRASEQKPVPLTRNRI